MGLYWGGLIVGGIYGGLMLWLMGVLCLCKGGLMFGRAYFRGGGAYNRRFTVTLFHFFQRWKDST